MSLRKAWARFIRECNFAVPRPNPPGYVAPITFWELTTAQKKASFTNRWTRYKATWTDEFNAPEDDEWKEKWNADLKEQLEAVREIGDEGAKTPLLAKAYMQQWIKVYRTTLAQFAAGYDEGLKGEPVETPAAARSSSETGKESTKE